MKIMKNCRCCQMEYTVKSFDFHNLCDNCFVQYDNQKMQGRFAPLTGTNPEFYTESVSEFIESGRCTHLSSDSFMDAFLTAAREHLATQ